MPLPPEQPCPKADEQQWGELFSVTPSGRVFWSRQSEFVLTCNMVDNLDNLPFDSQDCVYTMGMFADSDDRVVMRWKTNSAGEEETALMVRGMTPIPHLCS